MTPRERLLTLIRGEIPDCVPVAPDFSNMIPARLTGKPFWDLYLYNDPPSWEAYLEAAKYFDIDALMDGYAPLIFPDEIDTSGPDWQTWIVFQNSERIVTQKAYSENGKMVWAPKVDVYYKADSPTTGLDPEKIGLPPIPHSWKPLKNVKPVDLGPEGLRRNKKLIGDQGLVGVWLTSSVVLANEEEIYDYYDHPEKYEALAEKRIYDVEARFKKIMSLEEKPDFLCVGGSGTLVTQSLNIFRQIAFPAVKRAIELCYAAGMPSHIHSCGPEKELVKIMAEETNLTMIDPLEIPPMGDCHLKTLKELYGDKIILKGNLHTTEVMLRGTVSDVIQASRQAIDDAGAGGKFILSTGDQCGRDTPDENIKVMVETARTYGQYQ